MSFSSYNGYELSLHLTCFQRGFIAQLVEHCTGVTEVMGLNSVGVSEFFLNFICNCLSYFITVRISCVLYPECTHMIFIIYTPWHFIVQSRHNNSCQGRTCTADLSRNYCARLCVYISVIPWVLYKQKCLTTRELHLVKSPYFDRGRL